MLHHGGRKQRHLHLLRICLVTFSIIELSLSSLALSAVRRCRIAVVGGGASGIFSSIAAAEASKDVQVKVTVFEAGSKTLTKVKISGGGRCNVLHDTSKAVPELLNGYPRGKRELTGLLHKRFTPSQAREWFESRGVELKTEMDGRMFPVTDSSQTVIDTLLNAAQKAGVSVQSRSKVQSITKQSSDSFQIQLHDKQNNQEIQKEYDAVILATGSAPIGYQIATSLGHTIVPTVPSLFTLNCKHDVKEGGLLHGLSGLSVPHAEVSFRMPKVPGKKKRRILQQEGPVLITHHGLSGPAVLRLSAFGARDFHEINYRGELVINWAPHLGRADEVSDQLWKMTSLHPKRTVAKMCPLPSADGTGTAIPKRLWSALVLCSGFTKEQVWAEAPKKLVRKLAMKISGCPLEMTGKGTFKEEFVTAGGVSLKEIDMKTMQSKVCDGLFLCGELIDVDGVTGGFNFMNCWTTGFVAGTNAAAYTISASDANISVP